MFVETMYFLYSLGVVTFKFTHKCARNLILTMAVCGHTKTGQKIAAGWAGLAHIYQVAQKAIIKIKFLFYSCNQLNMRNVVKCISPH
jgi:hypothetical protein